MSIDVLIDMCSPYFEPFLCVAFTIVFVRTGLKFIYKSLRGDYAFSSKDHINDIDDSISNDDPCSLPSSNTDFIQLN